MYNEAEKIINHIDIIPPNHYFFKTSFCWEGKNGARKDPDKCNNMLKKMNSFYTAKKKKKKREVKENVIKSYKTMKGTKKNIESWFQISK